MTVSFCRTWRAQHSLDDQGACAELHCSVSVLALCEAEVKRNYKMTWTNTVSVQNNSLMNARLKAWLSDHLERQEPLVSQLKPRHAIVKATLHFYIYTGPLPCTTTMSPLELFGVGKQLFLWNTNRDEIAVCLPDGKMEVGQVPFVSYPHIPPTAQLYCVALLVKYRVCESYLASMPMEKHAGRLKIHSGRAAMQEPRAGTEHRSCSGDWHGANGRDRGWVNRLGKREVGGKETVEGRVR